MTQAEPQAYFTDYAAAFDRFDRAWKIVVALNLDEVRSDGAQELP